VHLCLETRHLKTFRKWNFISRGKDPFHWHRNASSFAGIRTTANLCTSSDIVARSNGLFWVKSDSNALHDIPLDNVQLKRAVLHIHRALASEIHQQFRLTFTSCIPLVNAGIQLKPPLEAANDHMSTVNGWEIWNFSFLPFPTANDRRTSNSRLSARIHWLSSFFKRKRGHFYVLELGENDGKENLVSPRFGVGKPRRHLPTRPPPKRRRTNNLKSPCTRNQEKKYTAKKF
jgi:hypothetical protein